MHLNCPHCTNEIQADGINLTKVIAKCQHCNNIFDFTAQLEKAQPPVPYRREIPIPPGITMTEWEDALELDINWRKEGKPFLLFFAIFWIVFVGVFTLAMVGVGEWIPLLFMIPFWGAGAYLLYASIGHMVNTTNIFVDEKILAIEHRPINFLIQKDKYIDSKDIKQLFIKRKKSGETNGNPVYSFALELVLNNGDHVPLIKELKNASTGRFIEHQIEKHLKISNLKVEGEWE